ncbi:hypothetical protein FA15DRAFT_746808 [Coprinopsis marcescibilis]|uniref:Endo-1,4-beta-xylanase n=1 Tax=Coprinopsis marcescibilis TaxID=230819 RepID=A0A5C3L4C1_COPMA|nr:hypothetical protein FA15DRAFT_746808 [Coprinopsis marcescibilis]
MQFKASFFALAAATLATAQSGPWGQCGGTGWSGATTCQSGYSCTVVNQWYSQCQPGSGNPPPSSTPVSIPTPIPTLAPSSSSQAPAQPTVPSAPIPAVTSGPNTPSSEGDHDGFFYSWWTDRGGNAWYTNQNGGQYTLIWSGNGNLVGGKGWFPGTLNRVISYNGTYQPNGNSYLAVYGWTRKALIEYYVVESWGTYNPASAASRKGTANCNGASYDVLSTWRNNQPSIDGTATFEQFWSVRNPKRAFGGAISGTVDFACHVAAWEKAGMRLGSEHYYQVVATEGYFSSGRATLTVREGA